MEDNNINEVEDISQKNSSASQQPIGNKKAQNLIKNQNGFNKMGGKNSFKSGNASLKSNGLSKGINNLKGNNDSLKTLNKNNQNLNSTSEDQDSQSVGDTKQNKPLSSLNPLNKQSNNNKNSGEKSFIDKTKDIITFIKKHPGLVSTIGTVLLYLLAGLLIIFVVIIVILWVQKLLSDIKQGITNFFESTGNFLTFSGFRTNQGVYHENMESRIIIYGKANDSGEKIRAYVNAATYYNVVVDPDLLSEPLQGDDVEKVEIPDDESKAELTSQENELSSSISTKKGLDNRYSIIKNDPIDLIENMYECQNGTENCTFSEEKYEKYLKENYVTKRYINCGECDYKDASTLEKENLANKMTNDILSEARSTYGFFNEQYDQSNYTIYNIYTSGVNVKNLEGELIGNYEFVEYLSIKVANNSELSGVNNEVKKAYALNEISKLLATYTTEDSYVVEDNFDPTLVTEEITNLVTEVSVYKIIKEGRVYYIDDFNIQDAQDLPGTYVEIIAELLGEDVVITQSISDGLQVDPKTGFYMRLAEPSATNALYYGTVVNGKREGVHGLIGECAWYVENRAREITQSLNVTTWYGRANGNGFCGLEATKNYNVCRGSNCTPKQGSIISWEYTNYSDDPSSANYCSYCGYGHVGIIEQVYEDEKGKQKVVLSEASVTKGNLKGSWSSVENQLNNDNDRFLNCTSPNNNGCMSTSKSNVSLLNQGSHGKQIKCIIYLTEPKNTGTNSE